MDVVALKLTGELTTVSTQVAEDGIFWNAQGRGSASVQLSQASLRMRGKHELKSLNVRSSGSE